MNVEPRTMKSLYAVLVVALAVLTVHAWGWGEPADTAVGSDGQNSVKEASTTTTRRPPQVNRKTAATKSKGRPTVDCVTQRDACQNFQKDIATAISAQVKEEFIASYTYMAMGYYFARDDVGMRGFAKFFAKMSDEEREHGTKLLSYLVKRGGPIEFFDIPKPTKLTWSNGQAALRDALNLEHHVNNKLLDLHWQAQEANDPHLMDFLETEYLTEQVDSIKELADWLAVLDRVKNMPLGENIFDQELYDGKR